MLVWRESDFPAPLAYAIGYALVDVARAAGEASVDVPGHFAALVGAYECRADHMGQGGRRANLPPKTPHSWACPCCHAVLWASRE